MENNIKPTTIIYDALKIEELEQKGLYMEVYGSKLFYYGLTGALIAGGLSKTFLNRFFVGFAFGLGYGAGYIHKDFLRAFDNSIASLNISGTENFFKNFLPFGIFSSKSNLTLNPDEPSSTNDNQQIPIINEPKNSEVTNETSQLEIPEESSQNEKPKNL